MWVVKKKKQNVSGKKKPKKRPKVTEEGDVKASHQTHTSGKRKKIIEAVGDRHTHPNKSMFC